MLIQSEAISTVYSTHAQWDWNAHYYLCNDNDIIELLKSGPAKTRPVGSASTTMQDIGGGLATDLTRYGYNHLHNKYVTCIANTLVIDSLPEEVKRCVIDPLS